MGLTGITCSAFARHAWRCLGAAMLLAGAGVAAAQPTARPVEAPHYGDGLFQFYQEQYFTAITTLMVSQHFERVAPHADDTELLRGGMLLSYGMHDEAGAVFARLIDQSVVPPVRDRAWFYLAKIRYQRGRFAEALDAIGRVAGPLPGELEGERVLLQANLLIATGNYPAAVAVLSGFDEGKENAARKDAAALPYARFNLGVALIRNGDTAQGSALLDRIGSAGATDEEQRALRDRANLALGFAALADKQPAKARGFLERVRLHSAQANKALLGYGWAAAELKNPQQALVPWTELAQRDPSDAAALEARIAVPYAYAELGAHGQALQRYEQAIAAFDDERVALDASIKALRSGDMVTALLQRNPGNEMGWFFQLASLPPAAALPHANHLVPLLAQHRFQEAFKNYRDLQFLARNLQGWSDNLGAFGDNLATRRRAFAERAPQVQAQTPQASREAALCERRDALAAELARAQADGDGQVFFDQRQAALLARLSAARATFDSLGKDLQTTATADRLRLVQGVLAWDLAQQYPQRVHAARRDLAAADRLIDEARTRDSALAQAQRDEPLNFDGFAARIAALEQRIRELQPRVAALTGEQQAEVQDMAVAELRQQQQRLQVYATQARFAVAQLYDRATLSPRDIARGSDDARQP